MLPPINGSEFDRELWRLAGEEFPSDMQVYYYNVLKKTAQAVKVIEDNQTEIADEKHILKLINDIRIFNRVKHFAPATMYKGGRYPTQNIECLEVLRDSGILNMRTSERKDINKRIYEFTSRYEDFVDYSKNWRDTFLDFYEELSPDLFESHYKNRILPWIADEDVYSWVTEEPWLRDPTSLENPPNSGHDDHKETREAIHDFDAHRREAAVILYRLLRDYKEIKSASDRRDGDGVDESALRLSIEYALACYEDNPPAALGKFVFYVGFFDAAEEIRKDPDSNIAYFREHPGASDSIAVKLPDSLDLTELEMYKHSGGLLATTREYQGELVLTPVALLESDQLPETLVQEQDANRKQRSDELSEERHQILDDLAENLGTQEPSLTKNEVIRLIDERLESAGLTDDERDAYEYFKHLLANAAVTKGIEWVLMKVAENFPEYIGDIMEAIEL